MGNVTSAAFLIRTFGVDGKGTGFDQTMGGNTEVTQNPEQEGAAAPIVNSAAAHLVNFGSSSRSDRDREREYETTKHHSLREDGHYFQERNMDRSVQPAAIR